MTCRDPKNLPKNASKIFSILANLSELPVNYETFVRTICPNSGCNLTEQEIEKGINELVRCGWIEIAYDLTCPDCGEFLEEFSFEEISSLKEIECDYCGYIIANPLEKADKIIKPTELGMEFFREYKDEERAEIIKNQLEILIRPIFAGFF